MTGVLIGLSDIHYTKIAPGATTAALAFANPIKRVAKAIEAKVTPSTSNAILYADDSPAESTSADGPTEIELGVDALTNAVYADLLGKTVNSDGVVADANGDIPPDVAIAYRALKSNGKYRYFWFLKGAFQSPEESYKTKGETVEYNTPTIKGVFVHSDIVKDANGKGIKRFFVDEDDTGVDPDVIADWFTAVYTGPTAP